MAGVAGTLAHREVELSVGIESEGFFYYYFFYFRAS